MFSLMLLIFQTTMMIAVVTFIPVTLMYRIYLVIKNQIELKKAFKIVLIPLSLGYIIYLDKDKKDYKYNIILYIYLGLTLIGILFTIYQRYFNFI